jgi:hypothetical protein
MREENMEEIEEKKSFLSIGIKELIGNFTPAYFTVLFIPYLMGKITDITSALGYIFLAFIIAIGMSAIQPYVINNLLRIKPFLEKYTKKSIREIKENIKKNKELDVEETEKSLNKSYQYYLKLYLDSFWEKKRKMSGIQEQFFEIREARLIIFFYFSILFALVTLILFIQAIFPNIVIFTKISELGSYAIYSWLGFLFITFIFLLGLRSEVVTYRSIIVDEIPVFAAVSPNNSLDMMKDKIDFLEKMKATLKPSVFTLLKTKFDTEYERLEELAFERDWVQSQVHKEAKISLNEIQDISNLIRKNSLNYRFNLISSSLIAVSTIWLVILTFFYQGILDFALTTALAATVTVIIVLYYFSRIRIYGFNIVRRRKK